MLRITVDQKPESVLLKLEGRVAGPWATELTRVWAELKGELKTRKLIIDLKSTTYADAEGTEALREIYLAADVEVRANSPWTQYLADEISGNATKADEES